VLVKNLSKRGFKTLLQHFESEYKTCAGIEKDISLEWV
jgi:hypothetical protein